MGMDWPSTHAAYIKPVNRASSDVQVFCSARKYDRAYMGVVPDAADKSIHESKALHAARCLEAFQTPVTFYQLHP